jgi:hypothetical protein
MGKNSSDLAGILSVRSGWIARVFRGLQAPVENLDQFRRRDSKLA